MSILPGTFGYGAVVLSHIDEFQGFYLVKDPSLNQKAVLVQLNAMAITPHSVHGTLQASLVDRVIAKDWYGASITALALWGITKEPYFWIKATKERDGTRTELFPLKAQSIHAAQIEVNNLPEVLEIKQRLRESMLKRKQ